MTQPVPITAPSSQDVQATIVAAGVQTLIDNAKRLGLTWQLCLGTVVDGTNTSNIKVAIDGDTTTRLGAQSMIGILATAQRVYLIQVPPGGLFVVGVVGENLAQTTAGALYATRQQLAGSAANVTFSNIPANLRSLRIQYTARTDAAVNVVVLQVRVNGNNGANYYYDYVQVNNTTVSGQVGSAQTSGICGLVTGAVVAAGTFGSGSIDFQSWDKTGVVIAAYTFQSQGLGSTIANFISNSGGGTYGQYGPYNSLTFMPSSGNFIAGTDFQLLGVYS